MANDGVNLKEALEMYRLSQSDPEGYAAFMKWMNEVYIKDVAKMIGTLMVEARVAMG